MIARVPLTTLGLLLALSAAPPVLAQEGDADEALAEDDSTSKDGAGDADGADGGEKTEAPKTDDKGAESDASTADASSPVEVEGQTYHFVGARYRLIVVPTFMMRLFASGGKTVAVHSFGPEFAIRKDGFEYNFGAWYAAYSMDPTPFKAKDDGEDAWELVESRIKIVYLTADFLWSHSFSPELALNYGGGAGIGFVFGPLYRNQAYRDASGQYRPCIGQGNPNVGSPGYCGFDNNHYNNYEEPSWGDGSKPILFPWLAVQTGLRYKPHKSIATRLDVGFGLSGFFVGLGADYGL